MKRFTITFCAAAILWSCNSNDTKTDETKVASSADSSNAKKEWVPVDSATVWKSMMENATPGQPHAMLAKSDGTWDAETTMWMTPDAPPQKSKGTSVNKMIKGGRFQQITFTGNFMGQPYDGTGIVGYDNAKKVYTNIWFNNMSTSIMNMEGTWDEASKSITFKGKSVCMANGQEMEMKEVFKIVDDNTQIMEMYGPDMKTGKQYKSMEIKFTRKK